MKNYSPRVTQKRFFKKVWISALACILVWFDVTGKEKNIPWPGDTLTEKKVDYLEQIYFSGGNKEELNTKILIALQGIQKKDPTPGLAKQVTFLLEIKEKAAAAENSCEILDMLSAGIYNIDAAEASLQGVRPPTDKAKAKSFDALASLNKLNSTTSTLSTGASNLAWSNYLLSGGSSASFLSGAGKLAGAAGTVGQLADAANLIKDLNLFKRKDKPCKDVVKKTIEIGDHTPATTSPVVASGVTAVTASSQLTTTTVKIPKISSPILRALADTLKAKPGVQSVEKEYHEDFSIVTVVHPGSTDMLADWLEDKLGSKFKLLDSVNGKINLIAKTGK